MAFACLAISEKAMAKKDSRSSDDLNDGEDNVPMGTLFLFSAPVFAGVVLQGPVGYLPGIFAKFYGLDLVALGAFFAIARLFDAITDPIMGYVSDNFVTRFGRRKPWIGLGSLLIVIFGFFLFFPSTNVTVLYFGSFYLLLTFGQTLVDIPHNAWAVGITRQYHQRTRIFFYRGLAQTIGSALFILAPLLPIFETTAITPDVLKLMFVVGSVLLAISVTGMLRGIPEPQDYVQKERRFDWRVLWSLIQMNPPFQYFLVLSLLSALGLGMYLALGFLYFDTYLKIGEHISMIGIVGIGVSLLVMPLWLKLASRWDKRHVFVVGALGRAITLIPFAFLTPGPNVLFIFLVLTAIDGTMSVGRGFMVPSIKSDIIDYGTWRTGVESAGTYMSFMNLITKVEFSLAGGLAFLIAGLFGYQASAESQTELAVIGLKITHLILPSLLLTISAIMMMYFPIDRRRQNILRRRLAQRRERAGLNDAQNAAEHVGGMKK